MKLPTYCFYTSGIANAPDATAATHTHAPWGTSVTWFSRTPIIKQQCFQSLENQIPIFVDSGAFHTATTGGQTAWETVFSHYFDLALNTDSPDLLTIVAPDVLGDQAQSLTLLKQYHHHLLNLKSTGVRILIPIQYGTLSIHEYLQSAALSPHCFGIGLPSNRNAYPAQSIEHELANANIVDLHLLGISAANKRFENLFQSAARSGTKHISSDSNRIRTMVGTNTPITSLQHDPELEHSIKTELDHESYDLLHELCSSEIKNLLDTFSRYVKPPADYLHITEEQLANYICILDSLLPYSIENWMQCHLNTHNGLRSIIRQHAVQYSISADTKSREMKNSGQIALL